MIGSDRGKIQYHYRQSIVLAQRQDSRHLRFSIRDPRLLLADGFDTLCEHKKALIDAGGLYESLLPILCSPIVLGTGQINS